MGAKDVLPPTPPPPLQGDSVQRTATMVEWFLANFADSATFRNPDDDMAFESQQGLTPWTWGGPYHANEVLREVFPEASAEIDAAVRQLVATGTIGWMNHPSRIADLGGREPRGQSREVPDDPDRNGPIVETILYPRRDWGWTVRATFVPGNVNVPPGAEWVPDGDVTAGSVEFQSVREMILYLLHGGPFERTARHAGDRDTQAHVWLSRIAEDQLFIDDRIVIHGSPPRWLPVSALGPAAEGMTVTGLALSSPSLGQAALIMVAYGGGRVFLRLVRNLNYSQDALFERLGRRIRRGDWKPFDE